MTPEAPSDPEVRALTVEGGRLAYTDEGEGAVVVVLHGLPGSVRDFRWLGAAAGKRLRIIRIDLPASGSTPRALMPSPAVADRAEVVIRALDALEIEEATVLGHSYGGVVALMAASRWPRRCSRLALLASVGRTLHAGFRRIPAPKLMQVLLDTPFIGRLFFPIYARGIRSAGFRGEYTRSELAHMNACIRAVSFEDNRVALAQLDVPTMVAWAEDDPLIETAVSVDLAQAAPPGPRLRWTSGGHNIQKSRAVEIAAALERWPGESMAQPERESPPPLR